MVHCTRLQQNHQLVVDNQLAATLGRKPRDHPPFVELPKKQAIAKVWKTPGPGGNIMQFCKVDESSAHQRPILGFIIVGWKPIFVVEEE